VGDAGISAPPYADFESVLIEDDGTNARVTVEMKGTIPQKLSEAQDEVEGLGVDLFREANQRESDYQLFADGEPDGWFAYLDAPSGLVNYPGTFSLDHNRMVFIVPWSSLGGMSGKLFSAFCDWSKSGTILNKVSEDHAPDSGKTPFSR
jgi:hypothetical protein